jgi:CheY-like chemotaxis protein
MTSSDPIRILIVENEGLVGCDMAASLGKFGHHVVGICASGEEALERFADLRPDLVLLDVHLSGQLDGIDTARELQRLCDGLRGSGHCSTRPPNTSSGLSFEALQSG